MSYQVLARKWRPKRFQEMVGQEHVLKALVNALDDDRLHHAYLFTGTRGVGKTSIARLFAKSLNCDEGVSSTPCGVCSSCKEIAEGRFVDLIEVDAASRTKVEDTRELLENVQYAPTHGRYKVYLIDEVHMLSTHSFNALLKTLEEPPPHVKFLLATTDPQKLPVTILSRCLQFNLKNMIPERIVDHLSDVLKQENVHFEEPALWLLARSADGSMRDAMSLTDQAIAFGAGEVNEADVRSMLGTIDQRLVYDLVNSLAQGDAQSLMSAVERLAQFSPDYHTVLGDLISLLHRIAVGQALPAAIDNSLGDQEQVAALAQQLTAEDVQLFYQVALMGRKDLPYVPDAREGLEMVLLRMLSFRPAAAAPLGKPEPINAADSAAVPSAPDRDALKTPAPKEHAPENPALKVQAPEVPAAFQTPEPVKPLEPVTPAPAPEQAEEAPEKDSPPWDTEGSVESGTYDSSEVSRPTAEPVTAEEEIPPKKLEAAQEAPSESMASSEVIDVALSKEPISDPVSVSEPSAEPPAELIEAPLDVNPDAPGTAPEKATAPHAEPASNEAPTQVDNEAEASESPQLPDEYADYAAYDESYSDAPDTSEPAENSRALSAGNTPESAPESSSAQPSQVNLEQPIERSSELSTELSPKVTPAETLPAIYSDESDDIPTEINQLEPFDWARLALVLGLRGMTANLANNISLEVVDETALIFHYRPAQSTLLNDVQRDRIRDALYNYFNAKPAVSFEEGVISLETPSERLERKRKERHQQAVKALEADPKVVDLVSMFSAKLDLETVEPIDPE